MLLPLSKIPIIQSCTYPRKLVEICFSEFNRSTMCKICYNTGFLWPVFSRIRTESKILYTGKYRSEKTRILAYFTQCEKNGFTKEKFHFTWFYFIECQLNYESIKCFFFETLQKRYIYCSDSQAGLKALSGRINLHFQKFIFFKAL